jgi:hypothetical protein
MSVSVKRFFYVACALLAFWVLPACASFSFFDDETPEQSGTPVRNSQIYDEIPIESCLRHVVDFFKSLFCLPVLLADPDHLDSPRFPSWLHWLTPTARNANEIIRSVEATLNDPKRLSQLQSELKPHYDLTVQMTRQQVAAHLFRTHVNTLDDTAVIDELVRYCPSICSAPRVWYAPCIDELIVSTLNRSDLKPWMARGHPAAFKHRSIELFQGRSKKLTKFISKWADHGLREARSLQVKGMERGFYGFEIDQELASMLHCIWFGYDQEDDEVVEIISLFGIGVVMNGHPSICDRFYQISACRIGDVLTGFSKLYGLLGMDRDPEAARRLILMNKIAY